MLQRKSAAESGSGAYFFYYTPHKPSSPNGSVVARLHAADKSCARKFKKDAKHYQ
jgi:hypothetical protein